MSGDLDVPRSTCYPARHLASAAMEEGIRRTQQQSVPPQVPQVGRAAGETGASPSISRPMLVASVADMVAEAKKPSRGILQWLAPSLLDLKQAGCRSMFTRRRHTRPTSRGAQYCLDRARAQLKASG